MICDHCGSVFHPNMLLDINVPAIVYINIPNEKDSPRKLILCESCDDNIEEIKHEYASIMVR